jgi:hypothetical protein
VKSQRRVDHLVGLVGDTDGSALFVDLLPPAAAAAAPKADVAAYTAVAAAAAEEKPGALLRAAASGVAAYDARRSQDAGSAASADSMR